jgi:hypothetical protein
MEAAYLFGGRVALLAYFQPFQDFRHPPVGGMAPIRPYAELGINVLELNRFAVAAISPSRNPSVQ